MVSTVHDNKMDDVRKQVSQFHDLVTEVHICGFDRGSAKILIYLDLLRYIVFIFKWVCSYCVYSHSV